MVWLHGVAGSGKSSIATSIEDRFRRKHQLGAFLKFERGKSDPSCVIRELAYKLALFDDSIGSLIVEHVNVDKDVSSALLGRQFEMLLLEPLGVVTTSSRISTALKKPVLIVVDALDECGTPSTRKELVRLLGSDFVKLPSIFRFLITSRPEPDIVDAFSIHPNSIRDVELEYDSEASRDDVRSYLDHEIRQILGAKLPVETEWASDLGVLARAAGGLFIWASTAIKFIETSVFPLSGLKRLVKESRRAANFGLDNLYTTILKGSGIFEDGSAKARFTDLIAFLLLSKISMSSSDMDKFLGFPVDESCEHILSRLRSVLSYTPGQPVRLFHASFSDYLLSGDRDNEPWFIDIPRVTSEVALRCLVVMQEGLHFDMCDLKTSYIRNDDVPGLDVRVEFKIVPYLKYACVYWAQHLAEAPFSSNLLAALSAFAHERLLFWMEVLSLIKKFRGFASHELSRAASWVVSSTLRTR